MYGFKILCEISKVPVEISYTILNPYTVKYAFYEVLKFWQLMISYSYDISSLCETGHWFRHPRYHLPNWLFGTQLRNHASFELPSLCAEKTLGLYFTDILKPRWNGAITKTTFSVHILEHLVVFWFKFHYNLLTGLQMMICELIAWHWIGDESLSEPMVTEYPDLYMRHPASIS